ncbi:hypothetical protein HYV44_02435 [Candidatus Microgenomates bacterium]|nr:hypothetical protein [Candidatus Microgenomates bacterium]
MTFRKKRRFDTGLFKAVEKFVGELPDFLQKDFDWKKPTTAIVTPLASWREVDQIFLDRSARVGARAIWLEFSKDLFSPTNCWKKEFILVRNNGQTRTLVNPERFAGQPFAWVVVDDGDYLIDCHHQLRHRLTEGTDGRTPYFDISPWLCQKRNGQKLGHITPLLALAVMHFILVLYDHTPSLLAKKIQPASLLIEQRLGVRPLIVDLGVSHSSARILLQ